jgi:hypothetical protein
MASAKWISSAQNLQAFSCDATMDLWYLPCNSCIQITSGNHGDLLQCQEDGGRSRKTCNNFSMRRQLSLVFIPSSSGIQRVSAILESKVRRSILHEIDQWQATGLIRVPRPNRKCFVRLLRQLDASSHSSLPKSLMGYGKVQTNQIAFWRSELSRRINTNTVKHQWMPVLSKSRNFGALRRR